jgi:hypothetical protein
MRGHLRWNSFNGMIDFDDDAPVSEWCQELIRRALSPEFLW